MLQLAEMKGENRIALFRDAGAEIVKRLPKHKSVVGAIFIGGIVRGFADKYSDVDVLLFLEHEDATIRSSVRSLAKEIEDTFSIETDIEVHVLDEYARQNWDEYLKWDLSNCMVVFDRHGRLSELLRKKLAVAEEEWQLRIAKLMIYITWYCFPEREHVPSMIDLWSDRGDPASAQYAVSYTLESIVELLYTLNRSFLPAAKWRIYHTRKLNWTPERFTDTLEDAMLIREISVEDARLRMRTLKPIWHAMLTRIQDEFGMDFDVAKSLYLQRVLHLPLE